jgi:hypothetical protein
MTREEILKMCNTPDWKWGTFEGAELHTLLLGLTTTFREKLEWLEEAETMILEMRAAQVRLAGPQGTAKNKNQPDPNRN